MTLIPKNLASLHDGEESLWIKAIEIIEQGQDLSAHVDLIERAMNLIQFFVREHVADGSDQETIQLLGIRLFNGMASASRLITGGYFQTAAMIQRDLLETVFLITYLRVHPEKIRTWRMAYGIRENAPKGVWSCSDSDCPRQTRRPHRKET